MYFNNTMMPGVPGVVPSNVAPHKTSNWLPSDKLALLQKGLGTFKLSVTEEEMAKGLCNHYNPDGSSALIGDDDGSGGCRCTICGTHFNSTEYDKQSVENATQNILDILNTIKVMYLSIDPQAALEFFQIVPFISKIPQLYEIAVADFKKYEGVSQFNPTQGANPFGVWNMMMSGYPMGGMVQQPMGMYQPPMAPTCGMPQQPAYNPMYQQPMGMPQQPAMQQPVMQQPMTGYQPQQGYAFNPMGAAQPQQPAQAMVNTNMPVQPQQPAMQQPAAPTTTDVKVDPQFKK